MPDSDTTPATTGIPARVSEDDDQLDDAAAERPSAREGLPSSYRMRADAHYVDWLASGPPGGREQMLDPRQITCHDVVAPMNAVDSVDSDAVVGKLAESIKTHGLLQPLLVQSRGGQHTLIDGADRLRAAIAAGLRKAPCITYDVDDQQARALAEAARLQGAHGKTTDSGRTPAARLTDEGSLAVGRSLRTLALCADMVSSDASPLSRTVATDLIRAEVWRSSCLLQAASIVRGDIVAANAPVPIRRLMDRVVKEIVSEQRLRGFELDTEIEVPDGTVIIGDESLLVAAVSGAILATLPIVEGPDKALGARLGLKVEAGAQSGGHQTVTIEVAQVSASAPDGWSVRAFDPAWTERPGGGAAALAMLSLRAIAELHQGRATASAAGRGTRIAITVPAGLPARRAWH